jgi:Family of unknown function (DUF6441)
MKLTATLARSLQADMQAELRDIERAVGTGTREAGRGLRTELRRQVTSAGLGQRLANSWRDRHYPNQKLDATSLIYTKAPQIIRAFDEGAVIRSRGGRFLAIPTENAPKKGTDGRRIRPAPSRSIASGRSGSCLGRTDRRCWWSMACGLLSVVRPESLEASGARRIGPGAADRVWRRW